MINIRIHESCGRITCGPGWSRPREASEALEDAEFWLIWQGRGRLWTRDREYALFPGFCALMRPGGIYDADHDEAHPLGLTFIHFDAFSATTGKRRLIDYRAWPEFFELDDWEYWDAVSRRVVQLQPERPEIAAALFLGLLLDLLDRPGLTSSPRADTPRQHRKRISELVANIRAGMGALPSVKSMAQATHVSPEHFSRIFKTIIGQSPRDFLVQTQISRARHFLTETDLAVGEIADRLGYADIFFFSRQFKEKTGVSPAAYRKLRRPSPAAH